MEEDNLDKPEAGISDHLYVFAKAAISSIPIVGNAANEFFGALILPSLAKRREAWIETIVAELRKLQEQVKDLTVENLSKDPVFVTTLIQASNIAIRNHQQEKLEALKNAVLNAALPNTLEDDLKALSLYWVDILTPLHLRVLYYFLEPKSWFISHSMPVPQLSMGSPASALESAFPDLDRSLYDFLVRDLYNQGLIGIESLHTMMSQGGIFASRTTALGNQFLKFITSPLQI